MVNATPALVGQLECVDADEVRAIMARREAEAAMERSRLAAVSAIASDASTEQDPAPVAAEPETPEPGNVDPDIAKVIEPSPEPDSPVRRGSPHGERSGASDLDPRHARPATIIAEPGEPHLSIDRSIIRTRPRPRAVRAVRTHVWNWVRAMKNSAVP
ncbi:hypothetical protein ACFVX3_23795 [Rhodococcus erythropolis]|jgi:hypothetical protein